MTTSVAHWNALLRLPDDSSPRLVAAAVLRVIAATGLAAVFGFAAGGALGGVVASATAMLVTLGDVGATRRSRVANMVLAALALAAGGVLGSLVGGTTYADEAAVLTAALVSGWVATSHPGISLDARNFALGTAVGAGIHFTDAALIGFALAGGAIAIAAAFASWRLGGLPPQVDVMDWRAGIRRALAGEGSGARFAACYALSVAAALLAADLMRVNEPYWAAMVVISVMRREGRVSLRIIGQYMAGTLAGVAIAALVAHAFDGAFALVGLGCAFAALARPGLALHPSIGFAGFTVFFVLLVDVGLQALGLGGNVFTARIYDTTVGCGLAAIGTLVAGRVAPEQLASAAERPA
jgi:hypothetical protein